MKLNVCLISLLLALNVGCAQLKGDSGSAGVDGNAGAPGAPAPIVEVPLVQQDINTVLADENTYRVGLGQTSLTQGLGCTLYTVTGGDRIQSSIAGHNTLTGISQVATFLLNSVINQPDTPATDGMNVLPAPLRPIYQNMYLLRCQGQIVVTKTDYYQFDVLSDDGSVLYIDGSKLVDNDNNHGITLASGSKYLRRGVHTIRLDYAQTGAGNQALILKAGGTLIDPMYLFH